MTSERNSPRHAGLTSYFAGDAYGGPRHPSRSFVARSLYNYVGYRLVAPPYALIQSTVGAIVLLYLVGSFSSAWASAVAGRMGPGRTLGMLLLMFLAGIVLMAFTLDADRDFGNSGPARQLFRRSFGRFNLDQPPRRRQR